LREINFRSHRLINLRIVLLVFSEGEEVGHANAHQSDCCASDGEIQVLIFFLKEWYDYLKGKICNTLENISYRKWLGIVIELKSHHFLSVGIDCAICESPQKAHYPSHVVELKHDNEYNSWRHHHRNQHQVAKDSCLAAELVDYEPDYKATYNFTNSKQSHRTHRIFEFDLIISRNRFSHHYYK